MRCGGSLVALLAALLMMAVPAHADPVVAAAGDIACDSSGGQSDIEVGGDSTQCHERATADLLAGSGATAVLPLGDEQYCCGSLSQFADSYDPTWGAFKSISHPAVGNHEYQTPSASGYFDYFNGVGNFSGPAGDRDKGYYSFDVGTWHLIAINSNCGAVQGCSANSPQEQWLRADLAAHPSACSLAYWHHPRFVSRSGGSHPSMQAIWSDLYAAGAEVVLSGHEHVYERFLPQNSSGRADLARGVTEFVVGTGGRSFGSWAPPAPNSRAFQNTNFGILVLTLQAAGYDWRFVPEAGGTYGDSGSAPCHGTASGVIVPPTAVGVLTVGGRGTPVTASALGAQRCTIVGSPLDDVLKGTPGNDVICGLGGNDMIDAGGGNDVVVAGPGDDLVLGGDGRDRLIGNAGKDRLEGGSGWDRLDGGHGQDRLFGNDGRDLLDGGPGDDRLLGGNGRDRFYGGPGADVLLAFDHHGRDRLDGGRGRDKAVLDQGDRVRNVERETVIKKQKKKKKK